MDDEDEELAVPAVKPEGVRPRQAAVKPEAAQSRLSSAAPAVIDLCDDEPPVVKKQKL